MGEGVDPTEMCQSLVDKVARSTQLTAIAEPELLVLFEDWLEELEAEAILAVNDGHARDTTELARRLKVSSKGANFLLSKLSREGKIDVLHARSDTGGKSI
ncbi:MAG: hypothetical protein K9N21_08765 [Deltaproteobacteria bacterium]|nr:hypothetical protein [Deltaproteobacteria bacterium]